MIPVGAALRVGVKAAENARYRPASAVAPKLRKAILAHFASPLHTPFRPNLARVLIIKLFAVGRGPKLPIFPCPRNAKRNSRSACLGNVSPVGSWFGKLVYLPG